MKKLSIALTESIPFFVLVIGLSGLIYISVQQIYRQGLNDPQIQLVRDGELALLSGKVPAEVVGRGQLFDIEKSLKPFIAIYDNVGNLLESNASIGNNPPIPPTGVFLAAKKNGESHVTWQPNTTTRIALIVRPVAIESGWFIVYGRNMSLTEERIATFGNGLALGTSGLLFLIFLVNYLSSAWRRK